MEGLRGVGRRGRTKGGRRREAKEGNREVVSLKTCGGGGGRRGGGGTRRWRRWALVC